MINSLHSFCVDLSIPVFQSSWVLTLLRKYKFKHTYTQTRLTRQNIADKATFFFCFFFYVYKFVSTRHRELWNTILKAIYDNLCSLGVCKFPSQALTSTALTMYTLIFYFLSTSSESSPNTVVLKLYHIYQSKTTDGLIKWHHVLLRCVLYFKTELAAPRPGSLPAVTNMHSWAPRPSLGHNRKTCWLQQSENQDLHM